MRHRHSGPAVRYRTRRGNTRYRNRPMHKITMKGKERRRGARRFLGFGKSGDEIASDHEEYIRVSGEGTGPVTIGEIERGEAINREDINEMNIAADVIARRDVRRKRHDEKRDDEYTEEELDYLRDTYDKEPEEIEESEAEQAIEEFREDKKDERLLDELNERKQPGFGKKDIDVWENYTGD